MKRSPQMQRLEEVLRSSKLVAGGFMGSDTRSVAEIIEADAAKTAQLGVTAEKLAARMQEITGIAKTGLGNWVKVDEGLEAVVDEAKGAIVCPWPHPGRFAKRITTARLVESGRSVRWADLNIHLIARHGFFEGKGSAFRLEPDELVKIIF
ncbi:MAG: hypothetical protein ACYSR5_04535 [Planctomycetota bacterium]